MMDADLQDPPSLLPEMCGYIEQGYDSVATRRVTRKGEPPVRSFFARMFYRLMNKISKTEISLPKFREKDSRCTLASSPCSFLISCTVLSVEPSST